MTRRSGMLGRRARVCHHGVGLILVLALAGCSFGKGAKPAEVPEASEEGDGEAAAEAGGSSKKKPKTAKAKVTRKSGKTSAEPEPEAEAEDAPEAAAEQAPAERPRPERPEMSAKATRAVESAEKAFVAGNLAGAQKQYEEAIASDPQAYEAHYGLGAVHERRGNLGKAAKSYQAAYRVVPDYEQAIIAHARLLAEQENYTQALSLIQEAKGDWGSTAGLLTAESEVLSMQGQSGRAQELAQEALKADPTYKPAMVALARDHYRARRIDLALYALTGILDGYGEGNPPRDAKNAEARLLRGLIYSERGLRGPAMDEMRAALEVRPDLVDAHLVLANYMMEAGNAEGARPHLENAIRYDNKNVAAHLQLGDAYRLLGQPDKARKELEWVLKAEPNQAEAHYNLGLVFLLSREMNGLTEMQALEQAVKHLEAYKAKGVRGGPDDVDELITRAKTRQAVLKATQDAAAGG